MDQFRCKICGRMLGNVPGMCACGNNNPAMWELLPGSAAPNAQNMNAGVYPPNAAPYTDRPPVYPPMDAVPPGRMREDAPTPPPTQAAPGQTPPKKKSAAAAVLCVLLALLVAGAGVLGYFTYRAYASDDGTGSSGSARKRTRKNTADTDEAQVTEISPATDGVSFTPLSDPAAPEATKLLKLPDFTGENYETILRDAYYTGSLTLNMTEESSATVPAGAVISQSLTAGSIVNQGAVLTLTVSTGAQQLTMPDVTGMQYEAAVSILSSYHLTCQKTERVNPGDRMPNAVADTVPVAGTPVNEGDTVTLNIWGPRPIMVDPPSAYLPEDPSDEWEEPSSMVDWEPEDEPYDPDDNVDNFGPEPGSLGGVSIRIPSGFAYEASQSDSYSQFFTSRYSSAIMMILLKGDAELMDNMTEDTVYEMYTDDEFTVTYYRQKTVSGRRVIDFQTSENGGPGYERILMIENGNDLIVVYLFDWDGNYSSEFTDVANSISFYQ